MVKWSAGYLPRPGGFRVPAIFWQIKNIRNAGIHGKMFPGNPGRNLVAVRIPRQFADRGPPTLAAGLGEIIEKDSPLPVVERARLLCQLMRVKHDSPCRVDSLIVGVSRHVVNGE